MSKNKKENTLKQKSTEKEISSYKLLLTSEETKKKQKRKKSSSRSWVSERTT